MPKAETSSCPACGAAPGALSIEVKLIAKPCTAQSLAGVQMKTGAQRLPVLTCAVCLLKIVGTFDDDGRHVTFN